MLRSKTLPTAVSAAFALLLLTAAFAGDSVGLGATPPLAARLAPRDEPFGPSTQVRSSLFGTQAPPPGRFVTEADLAPALDGTVAAQAKALYDASKFTEALTVLTEDHAKTPPERFLRALCLLKAGKAAEAAAAFVALIDAYPQLADRCRFLAGAAYERAGDLPSAAGAYDAVEEGSLLFTEAQFSFGDVLRREGDYKASAAVWAPLSQRPAPLWGWDIGGDALYELGVVQELAGQKKLAGASFLKVWSEHAAARKADAALDRADALDATPTPEQTILHAEGLMEAHQNQLAVNSVESIVEAPPKGLTKAWLCRARYVLGKSYRKLRWHAKAVEVLDGAVRDCQTETELWARTLYVAGTSATFVNPESAIRYYRILAQEAPDSSLADDALFEEGTLLQRAGRPEQARIALQRLVKLYPDGDNRAEGLFQLFWLERSQGRGEHGLKSLERLAHDYEATDPVSVQRARYWRARTLVEAGRMPQGIDAYEELVLKHPASFYALLARSRLSEIAPERGTALAPRLAVPAQPPPLRMPLGSIEGDRHLIAALELMRLGLNDNARDELLGIDRGRLRSIDSSDALRALVVLLGRAGEVRIAHAIARNELYIDLSGTLGDNALVWRAAYPLAFRDEIEQHSQEASIDPDLLQALIREESALDPKVHSWAGAIGLCQLMPYTAREVAGWLKIKGPLTLDRLHDPDLNVQLGATYLGRLIKQMKGNLALSLASYNAGAGAVSRWVVESRLTDLDEFIEQIPISETRNYVKRVLKTYAAYQYVYGRSDKPATLAQPLVASN